MHAPNDSCTTILVGKNASYDGSTMMARTEDAPAGHFFEKKTHSSKTFRTSKELQSCEFQI